MALPKKRHTRARRGNRNAHAAMRVPNLSICEVCSADILSHRACPHCGSYRGREYGAKKVEAAEA